MVFAIIVHGLAASSGGPSVASAAGQHVRAIFHHARRADGGPWPRPSAKRLCELVLLSPGRCITRDRACEELFPHLAPKPAHNAVARALSLARVALSTLGEPATSLLQADRNQIWAHGICLEVDVESHQGTLKHALSVRSGTDRDQALTEALLTDSPLLGDEPDAEWAVRHRERLESLRQEARLALARDRSRGLGWSSPEAVVQAWEDCLSSEPACEEAACALVRLHSAVGRRSSAEAVYRCCRAALEDLGLAGSQALEEAHAVAIPPVPALVALAAPVRADYLPGGATTGQRPLRSGFPSPMGAAPAQKSSGVPPSCALARVITQVEAFGAPRPRCQAPASRRSLARRWPMRTTLSGLLERPTACQVRSAVASMGR